MSLTADAVTQILETRYDYYSARVVLKQAAERAELDAAGPFDAAALGKLADVLLVLGDRVEETAAALKAAGEGGRKKTEAPAAPAKPAETAKPAPDAPPAPDADAEDADADDKKDDGKGKKKK